MGEGMLRIVFFNLRVLTLGVFFFLNFFEGGGRRLFWFVAWGYM